MNGENIKRRQYPEVAAGGFSRVDGTILFYQRVNALHAGEFTVLDLGAGRGQAHLDDAISYRRNLMNFKGRSRCVIGLDIDPAVKSNPALDEADLIVDGRFPIDDSTIDLIICDHTLEHVDDPATFCSEVGRVLKSGGWFCARTPNKFGYVSIASRMIPDFLHQAVLRVAQPTRKSEDIFNTHYLLNTRSAVKKYFGEDSWNHYMYFWNSEPAYFGNSPLMWTIARFVTYLLPPAMGTTLHVFSQKK